MKRVYLTLTSVLSIFGKEDTPLIESVKYDTQTNHVVLCELNSRYFDGILSLIVRNLQNLMVKPLMTREKTIAEVTL